MAYGKRDFVGFGEDERRVMVRGYGTGVRENECRR